ncbi:MAG: MBL fold metallo-hydrolase [Candidatus Brocadiia bacterium]
MKVIFWGVRGSVPTPRKNVLRYGGNTTCYQVLAGGRNFVVDSGTGIIELGRAIESLKGTITLLFSHLHHDHTQGFPFFRPAFSPAVNLDIYAGNFFKKRVQEVLTDTMADPYFPVPLNKIGSKICFNDLSMPNYGDTVCGLFDGTVDAMRLVHPTEGVIVYSFREGNRKIVIATDCEHYDGRNDQLAPFIEGADIFIHDTMYTDAEYSNPRAPRRGWGHATIESAIELSQKARVKQLVCTHHEPTHSDDFLDELFDHARKSFPDTIGAYEGLQIEV